MSLPPVHPFPTSFLIGKQVGAVWISPHISGANCPRATADGLAPSILLS